MNPRAFGRSVRWLAVVGAAALIGGLFVQPAFGQRRSGRIEREVLGAQGATADPGTVTFYNGTPVTINDLSPATPYPSSNTYNWCPGTITDVNVSIFDFGHTFPDDVDIVLQGPTGQNTMLMSDAGGGTDVEDIDITFDDEAATGLPDSTALAGGTFKPTDFGAADPMPAPAPDPTTAALSVFDGTNPAGNWSLFVADNVGGDVGDIEFGWLLITEVTTQASGTRVCIPAGGAGAAGAGEPYPSEQTIAGRASPVQDVNVTLSGLSHTFPDDIDALLQGPGGQSVMLMSDAGTGNDINNINLTFDDEAAAGLPDAAQIASGTFKPTDHDGPGNADDTFPPPAPAAPSGTTLGVFDGTNPNGAWKLFIRDPIGVDQGILNSWSLQITTPAGAITVQGGKVKEGKSRTFILTRTSNTALAETVSFATKSGSAKAGKDFKALSGTLSYAVGETIKTVKVKTKDDRKDERKERFFLTATAGGITSQGTATIKDND